MHHLQGDLEATLRVICKTNDGKQLCMEDKLIIEKPLVAKLWQTRHYALPSEECFPDSTTSSSYEGLCDEDDDQLYKQGDERQLYKE